MSIRWRSDMPVKPLPSKLPNEKKIDDFINQGGKAIEDAHADPIDEWTMISLRLPKSMLAKIDAKRKETIGLTRNAFLLQIIQKQLD